MAPKKKLEGATVLNVKVDETIAFRLDALALARSKPGEMLTRSDVARLALAAGLATLEKEEKPARKPKR